MSRELKFRAWGINIKEYLKDADGSANCVYILGDLLKQGNWIFEQYTGLKDKNGKEIYDGDILEQFVCGVHNFKGKKCGRSTIWQVRWNKKECCFELHYLRGSLFGDSMMSDGDDYEVIGNIHENPELLGGQR